MQLRPYQEEARTAIFNEWNGGSRRTLLTRLAEGKTELLLLDFLWHTGASSSIRRRTRYTALQALCVRGNRQRKAVWDHGTVSRSEVCRPL